MESWRIYYHDGSTFSSEDGGPEDAPGIGVLVIAQWDPNLQIVELLHGDGPRVVDWYWWEYDAWLCGDIIGVTQYIASPGWKKLLTGRNVENAYFQSTIQRAAREPLP